MRVRGDLRRLNFTITQVEKDDPRGTEYLSSEDSLERQSPVGVVGRFASNEHYLIVTVDEVGEFESQSHVGIQMRVLRRHRSTPHRQAQGVQT